MPHNNMVGRKINCDIVVIEELLLAAMPMVIPMMVDRMMVTRIHPKYTPISAGLLAPNIIGADNRIINDTMNATNVSGY